MWLGPWLLSLALAAPPQATRWVREVQIGARPEQVVEVLRRSGATRIDDLGFQQPGAFAHGLLDPPGLLAQLHRAGVEPPFFDGLPRSGPRFVVAEGPEGRASYAFVEDRLWAMALVLDAEAVAPISDPFRPDRLAPLRAALDALCHASVAAARDAYGNPVAWEGVGCSGGRIAVRYDPLDSEAAVQVVLVGR